MNALTPIPFPDLVRRMRHEVETRQAVFDLPMRKWFVPDGAHDFGARHFGRPASTPVGPAAGPHTQLAQNIVLSWLAGGRIIELKTVQVNDRLDIPRPCIHVPNVGLNVEWSQELTVRESLREYAKAAYLIEILKTTRAFGLMDASTAADTVFDISVGYDLDGIRSEKVTGFIEALKEPASLFEELRAELGDDLADFRAIELPTSISRCVTVSTFHGCPPDQIEAIATYLLEELELDTIVKLNPTLLGFDTVRHLVVEHLGYRRLELRREAFDHDLHYDEALDLLRGLRGVAERRGTTIGAKFTNTLVVANDPAIFPSQPDPYMYLSGPPLHVIAMTLMQRVREELDFEFPVSFSAGIDAKNFADAVACGMVPVTTCTDLLRQGGYGRLPPYLRALGREMDRDGVTNREAFVLSCRGNALAAIETVLGRSSAGQALWATHRAELADLIRDHPDALPTTLRSMAAGAGLAPEPLVRDALSVAGRLNGRAIVPALLENPRYHATANSRGPRRLDKDLRLYDCINCDLCIPACPNDAIFAYETEPVTAATRRLTASDTGSPTEVPGAGFTIDGAHQLAVSLAACNECSNCEVYCPERGAPFRIKERVFLTGDDFDAPGSGDGFVRDGHGLRARLGGVVYSLFPLPTTKTVHLTADDIELEIDWDTLEILRARLTGAASIDTATLWRMKTVRGAIFESGAPSTINPAPGRTTT